MVQRRIHEVEEQLAAPQFIEELRIDGEKVSIGTKVVCLNLDTDEEIVYTILGPADAAPEKKILSRINRRWRAVLSAKNSMTKSPSKCRRASGISSFWTLNALTNNAHAAHLPV